jgi:hypothetical protein
MSFASVVKQQIATDAADTTDPPSPSAVTWNGARSHATSDSARLDFFYAAARGVKERRFENLLHASYEEDALHTLKIIAYVRDVRGGKGERSLGRQALKWLAGNHPEELKHNLKHFVSEYGRFDDTEALMGTSVEDDALDLLKLQLEEDLTKLNAATTASEGAPKVSVSLCAKWVPSEKKKLDKKHDMNKKLARRMKLTSAQLRKVFLSPLRKHLDILERRMCAKEWDEINFNKVPSVAMHLHGKPDHAFETHLKEKFTEWKRKLVKGEAKVNAAVLFPHQVVGEYFKRSEVDELLEAQWKVMVEQAAQTGDLSKTLVLSDVSGSMLGTPMEVSIALGLMVSSLGQDDFKDLVLTFESNPQFHHVVGETLFERVRCLMDAPWGGSTNFTAAFREILRVAKKAKLTTDQMPERLIVISDMQFNAADNNFDTNFAVLRREFLEAGFAVPQLVFWNVNRSTTDLPVRSSEANVSLVSGFSPAILKCVLSGEMLTPLQTLLNVVLDDRYDRVTLPAAAADDSGDSEDAVLL